MSDDLYKRLEARIAALERITGHISDPDDQRFDRLLRKLAKSVEMTAWLGGMCIRVAPVIAAIWWFGDEAWISLKEWLSRW